MQISTQCASSTAAAIASNVEPDIISVSTHTLKLRERMLAAMRSTVGCRSHWYLCTPRAPERHLALHPRGARTAATPPPALPEPWHMGMWTCGLAHEIIRCPAPAFAADGAAPTPCRSSIAASAPRQGPPTPTSLVARA